MAKTSSQFVCSECGWSGPKWLGRCPECGQWGTIEEFHEARPSASSRTAAPGRTSRTLSHAVPDSAAKPITEISTENISRIDTGFTEFNRVLGGGIVPGSVTLIAGEPGIGKSTLLLETAGNVARLSAAQPERNTVLYISGEESQAQVRMRASRIGAVEPNLLLAATTDLSTALGLIEQCKPALAIVDSAQTIVSQEVDGISGGSTQVREVASALIDTAKTLDIPVLLVGHVTKDGSIAGPRTLEHLVDVVCQFEGDTETALRMLRAVKNRFGPTDEVGCFDMSGEGIEEVTDPSGLFLSSSNSADPSPVEGTCVTFTLDGHRSLPIEVQSLVTKSVLPTPRRAANGVDANRIAMLEHSIYSVISPEGCASILWKDAEKMREAAHALKLTAQDLKKLGVIDQIIPEPLGGAQRAPVEAIDAVGDAIHAMLAELAGKKPAEIIKDRRQKFLAMGSKALA